MKARLLSTVSAAAIALGALSAEGARADIFEDAFGDNWYVSVFGGGAFNESAHSNYNRDIYDIRLTDGFTVGGAFGGEIAPGLRAEQEISYVRHSNRDTRFDDNDPRLPLSGNTDALYILANLWKDIDLGLASLYAGGGIGTAILGIDGQFQEGPRVRGWGDSAVAFAAQIGGGVRVGLTDRLAFDAGYRLKMATDAGLASDGFFGNENAALTLYDHIFQAGLTYAMGSNAQVLPAGAGNPDEADWYVSLFAGALIGEDMGMDYGRVYGLDNKTGFTIGGAIGNYLAPGLRSELELSYMRQAAESYSGLAGGSRPSSGDVDQIFVLANLWKDFHVGAFSPYVGAGVGVGYVNTDDYVFNGATVWETDGAGLAGQFGAGVRVTVTENLALDAGYRFKSIVNAFLPGDTAGASDHTSLATYNHIVQVGLTYGFGGMNVTPVADPDPTDKSADWYVSIFAGAAIPEETHVSYFGGNYLTDFKTGFTVGAVVGTNVLPAMRGELELSYVEYDSDTSTEGGVTLNSPGDVGAVFLLANLWQDFDIGMSFTPYGGFGLGMAFANVDIDLLNNGAGIDDTSTALGTQLGAGITFDVSEKVTIDAGYRFKMALDVLTDGPGNFQGMASYYTHVLQAGAGLNF